MKLFYGSEASDTILTLVASTNSKLAAKHSLREFTYQPWMSIPSSLSSNRLNPTINKSRFLTNSELTQNKKNISTLDENTELIPSKEKYNLIISDLDEDSLKLFNKKISSAENELISKFPFFKKYIEQLIQCYIPIENINKSHVFDYGMSVLWYKGAIFFEKNQLPNLERRVENLAHEIAHQVLINYQLNDTLIINNDLNTEVYSGIRKTNRPAIMALHGAAALSYMLMVAKSYEDGERVNELKTALKSTLESLDKINFTQIGKAILQEINESL